jgi:hypothetical protein
MLKSEFEMKDLGSAKRLLGMYIRCDKSKGRFWLSQNQYIEMADFGSHKINIF